MNSQFIQMLPQVVSIIGQAARLAGANEAVPKVLDTLAIIVKEGAEALDDLMELRAMVKLMVAESREPTEEEWAALRIRSDVAHDAIQSYNIDSEQDG